jgi:hypothetical protein
MMTLTNTYAIKVQESLRFQQIQRGFRAGRISTRIAMNLIDEELMPVFTASIGKRMPTDKDVFLYGCAFRELCQFVGLADAKGHVTIKL